METAANGNWIFEIFKMLVTSILGGAAALWLPFFRRFFWGPELSLSFGRELEGCVPKTPISYDGKETEGYYIRTVVSGKDFAWD